MSNHPAHPKVELSSKAHITHDASGNIISVGRVPLNSRVRIEVKPRNKAHSVTEVDLDSEQAEMTVLELHKRHKIVNGKLVKM